MYLLIIYAHIFFRSSALDLFDELYAIEVGYNRTPQGSKWMLKRNIYIIHYITAGKGKFMNKNFIAGDAYIVIPNELEMIEAESSYESYWLMFKGTKANSVVKSCELPLHNDVFKFTQNKRVCNAFKAISRCFTRKRNRRGISYARGSA